MQVAPSLTIVPFSFILRRMEVIMLVLAEVMQSFFGECTPILSYGPDRKERTQLTPEQQAFVHSRGLSDAYLKSMKRNVTHALNGFLAHFRNLESLTQFIGLTTNSMEKYSVTARQHQ